MSTCNWLDLQTLGSQPIVSKILPDHWLVGLKVARFLNWIPTLNWYVIQ